MISPYTPPGTKVVCVFKRSPMNPLVIGQVYTIHGWVMNNPYSGGPNEPCVLLVEFLKVHHEHRIYKSIQTPSGFCRQHFRLADLPRCLTELLEPVNLPREALV